VWGLENILIYQLISEFSRLQKQTDENKRKENININANFKKIMKQKQQYEIYTVKLI